MYDNRKIDCYYELFPIVIFEKKNLILVFMNDYEECFDIDKNLSNEKAIFLKKYFIHA